MFVFFCSQLFNEFKSTIEIKCNLKQIDRTYLVVEFLMRNDDISQKAKHMLLDRLLGQCLVLL